MPKGFVVSGSADFGLSCETVEEGCGVVDDPVRLRVPPAKQRFVAGDGVVDAGRIDELDELWAFPVDLEPEHIDVERFGGGDIVDVFDARSRSAVD